MVRVRTILTHIYLYHAAIAVALSLIFISPEHIYTFIQRLDNDRKKWWSIYACVLGFFYFFSSPFVGEPSYRSFSRWYITWLFTATVYHLPSFQSMGVDMMMNSSLFSTVFISSIFVLIVFHSVFLVLWYTGLVSRNAGRRPEILSLLQNSAVIWTFSISWSAPVGFGSASDDPLFLNRDVYGESSDEILPISLLEMCIVILITNYAMEMLTGWALTLFLSDEESGNKKKPKFLDMVPWYSGTSADLIKTLFDLLVSVTVFLGRFDMRMMQAAMSGSQEGAKPEDFLYDHFSEKDDFWFDFVADTGDGGSSSYSVARLLAQPSLDAKKNDGSLNKLPRGGLLLIGGDLAYPNPSADNYENRFIRPFKYALPWPLWYRKDSREHITINKPELPIGVSDLKQYDGPQCFVIPGNHDWFDGLQTFMRYICHKSWLGGWLMPQKKSYFALQLPKGWWVFGFDVALHGDIDSYQFNFFSELIRDKVKEYDSVIMMTHSPNWILKSYWNDDTGKNVSHLICRHLKGRCKLRIAGDLHHYMRHSNVQPEKPAMVQHLLVNGCGGAFLHPTHIFGNFIEAYDATYETKATYPSVEDSSRLARGNIWNFRKENWQFDFIGGSIYFILTFSMFPLCKLDHILQDDTSSGHIENIFSAVWDAFMYMVGQSYVSFVGALILLVAAILFVPSKVSKKKKVIIGVLHVSAHIFVALLLMLLMELCVQICIRNNLLATSGYHSLYEWYRTLESKYLPYPTEKARIEQWTLGFYPTCIKYLLSAFDVPEVMAVTRTNICKNGMVSLSRGSAIIYYVSVFMYFWVLSTPAVSIVFGSYLYICINWLHLHFDEAFSSLRIADYKSFTRFHIKEDGNLEVFTLAVDKVPNKWKVDSNSISELKQQKHQLSHLRQYPSKWMAKSDHQDPINNVRIVDDFVIKRDEAGEIVHVDNAASVLTHAESYNESERKSLSDSSVQKLHSHSDNEAERKLLLDSGNESERKIDLLGNEVYGQHIDQTLFFEFKLF